MTLHEIYIGSANKNKVKTLYHIIATAYPTINIHTPNDAHPIPPPHEYGKTEAENALIKARHYFALTQWPTISEDDGVYFDQISTRLQPGTNAHRNSNKTHDAQAYWFNFLTKHQIKKGHIKKAYAYYDGRRKYIGGINIPFSIIIPTTPQVLPDTNPLNSFIIPIEHTTPIAHMTHEEHDRFLIRYIYPPIQQLFKKILSGQNK